MREEELILRPKRMRGEDGYRTFSIRIKSETADQIGQIAQRTGYSRNELIGRFLEYAIQHCTIVDE